MCVLGAYTLDALQMLGCGACLRWKPCQYWPVADIGPETLATTGFALLSSKNAVVVILGGAGRPASGGGSDRPVPPCLGTAIARVRLGPGHQQAAARFPAPDTTTIRSVQQHSLNTLYQGEQHQSNSYNVSVALCPPPITAVLIVG